MLNTLLNGTQGAKPPLLIVHGLYGSGRNWGVIAKRLSDERRIMAAQNATSATRAAFAIKVKVRFLAGRLGNVVPSTK